MKVAFLFQIYDNLEKYVKLLYYIRTFDEKWIIGFKFKHRQI